MFNWQETEEKLERELSKRQKETQMTKLRTQKILEENEEIRKLKEKISRAYLNKHHAAQIAEKQMRENEELVKNKKTLTKDERGGVREKSPRFEK